MNKHVYFLAVCLLLLLQAAPGWAQYKAATPDGVINDGEYGSSENTRTADSGKNGTAGGKWYMTWDATKLYVAKTGGDANEPDILYLDLNPIVPVTGGDNSDGNVTGVVDYGVTPTLPFRADVRVYVGKKDGLDYIEIRRRDTNGAWSAPYISNLSIVSNGTTREFSLPWAFMLRDNGTGTIPASFNWLGYAVTTDAPNNVRYDQVPANATALGTAGDITPPMPAYYTIAMATTATSPTPTKPFSLLSYTFLDLASNAAFPSINAYDFTMNSTGLQITRGSLSNWNITGNLVIGSGSVSFGSNADGGTFGTTSLGNLRVLGTGILDMSNTPNPLNILKDISVAGGKGAQVILSNRAGGDLNVGHDLNITGGASATFQTNNRAVTFTNSGIAHSIITSPAGYTVGFDYLSLNSSSGTLALGNDIQVRQKLNFYQGNLLTGNQTITLATDAVLAGEGLASHIIGNVRITQAVNGINSLNAKSFGNIGFTLKPQDANSRLGQTTVTRTTGFALRGPNNSMSIERYFYVTFSNPTPSYNITLQATYRFDELNGAPEANLVLYKSASTAGPFESLTGRTTNTATHTITRSDLTQARFTSGTYLTLGDGEAPLPVTLVSFTAKATAQGTALLRWVTAMELNNKGFSIERQFDGSSAWQSVGYVTATNRASGSTYEFTDKSLASVALTEPLAYYRLRQEDLDGKVTYSPAAVVARKAQALAGELTLSPVPVTGSYLSVTMAEVGQAGLEVAVINTQGQRMLHFTTEASSEATLSLLVDQLAAGVYIVSVRVPGQALRHARFVKL